MSTTLMYDDVWADLVGKCFVLGVANAKGEYVITLGGDPLADSEPPVHSARRAREGHASVRGFAGGGQGITGRCICLSCII